MLMFGEEYLVADESKPGVRAEPHLGVYQDA